MAKTRTEHVRLRMSPEELASVDKFAELEGERRSEFIRVAIDERRERLAATVLVESTDQVDDE